MDIKTQKMLADVVLNAQKKSVQPYTTTAKVKSVADDIVYVEIPGSDRITPVKSSSVAVKKGDIVDLAVSHSDTHITGNRSDVATPQSSTKELSQAIEATRLEMDNELDLTNNKIKMVNNDIEMMDNTITMQGNTITEMNNTIDSQNNTITQQGNSITEINNTVTEVNNKVESQGNTITQINNTITQQGNTITEMGNKVDSQGNTITEMNDTITSQGNTITQLDNKVTSQGNTITQMNDTVTSQGNTITQQGNTITEMNSTIETLNSAVETQGSTIQTLDSSIKVVNSAFVIQNGKLTGISEILTNILDSDYVTTDLLNADVAWIENGKIKQGAIGTVEIADSSITTAKIAELSADVITTGTLKTECLILTTDEVDPETGEKKVALITALNAKTKAGEGDVLDGAIIKDNTIEAAKITVVDLNAFGATIGNFHIGTSSMYNNKTSLTDPTNGVYIGADGIALGQGSLLDMTDDSPFRVESDGDFHLGGKENNYINFDAFSGELDIDAKSIKMGSSTMATVTNVNDAKDAAISAAASDATAKANQAKSDAVSEAATDATNKADAAKSGAISTVNETLKKYATLEVTNDKISTAVTETKAYADSEADAAVTEAKSYTDQTAQGIESTVQDVNGRLTTMEQNASGFTWSIDETAIVSSVNEYYKSTSPTSLAGGSWSTTQPTWTEGAYIWMRAKNTNGKGVSSYTTAVCITGNTGAKGDEGDPGTNGTDGKGIKSTAITYQAWSNGTTTPTGTWSTSVPSTTADKPYLWTKTVITYTDNTTSISYSVGSTPEGIEVGGQNLLSDTNIPSMTKKTGPGDKYLSDSSNADYSTGAFVAVSNLPVPGFTHVFRFTCTTASSTASAGRSLCFYSDATVPMINGQEYTMSMYARKTSGNGKIRFMVGYSSYPDYNNYIDVTSEWKRYSYTFTYSDSATGGSGGARAYFGASCAVVGVVETFGWKLERGNKATDWSLSVEAGKTATNYMNFSDEGLIVGNMTASTLGRNVLIDDDSVDIRNGSEVLASYGERIVLKNKNENAFIVSSTSRISSLRSFGREKKFESYTTNTSYFEGVIQTTNPDYREIPYSDGWLFQHPVDKRYIVFNINETISVGSEPFYLDKVRLYDEDKTEIELYLRRKNSAGTFVNTTKKVPIYYCDENAISKVEVNGTLQINNTSDINGLIYGDPPFSVGDLESEHLEIDGNEIMAKTDSHTPGSLYLNMEGGTVFINNNDDRAIKFQDGAIYSKNNAYYKNEGWLGLVDGLNDSGNTTFGYGNYIHEIGETSVYGNMVNIVSKTDIDLEPASKKVNCKSNIYLDNNLVIYGKTSAGATRSNFQPVNSSGNCVLGWGNYSAKDGSTNIYGHGINLHTTNYLNSNRELKVLWSGSSYMHGDQTASLSEKISNQLNGIVLAWSGYVNGTAQNYWWNYFFIPKEHVKNNAGAGVSMFLTGTHFGYKYIYVSDSVLSGNVDNNSESRTIAGVTIEPRYYVLRYVYGV